MAGPVGKAAIEILDKARHDRAGFRCGVVELEIGRASCRERVSSPV